DSRFRIKGSINGITVTFLIDTGATSIAVSTDVARRAHLSKQATLTTETAGGNRVGYFTKIDTINIGGIDVHNVSGVIVPDLESDQALLGMNVLEKFSMQQIRDTLILTVPQAPSAHIQQSH
ncbi:MAG TPA: TIGR02281 family clan AA aspartic protease, partial [Gammaproteobacteria bacterium]|nr:TIGR02281 family clan AA aspartic protease [Gammaproteobacteria bacterium]